MENNDWKWTFEIKNNDNSIYPDCIKKHKWFKKCDCWKLGFKLKKRKRL